MLNILFTSAGRRVELLAAFRKALRSLNLEGKVIAVDTDPLAATLREADAMCIVPPLQSSEYVPALLEICKREKVNLVFPLIDPDIPVLSKNRARFENAGTQVAVVAPEALENIADKWRTSKFFERLGIPIPHSWLPGTHGFLPSEYPLFIKPRGGSAGRDGFRVANASELAFFSQFVPEPLIQEYLPDPEITTDVACGLDGEILGLVSRERIEIRGGEVTKSVTVRDERILNACIEIVRGLPGRGPITIQCMMKDGAPYFTEINARFAGGVPLGFAAGLDSPRLMIARAAGIHIPVPPLGSYRVGLYMTRCDHSIFFGSEERENVAHRTPGTG